jgi:hypothetical protein
LLVDLLPFLALEEVGAVDVVSEVSLHDDGEEMFSVADCRGFLAVDFFCDESEVVSVSTDDGCSLWGCESL